MSGIKEKGFVYWKSGAWKRLLAFIIFCALAWNVFLRVTYLFRNADYARSTVTGIKETDDIDIVLFGASTIYEYWQNPYAYEEYGIASYSYTIPGMRAVMVQSCIEDMLQYQDPELIIVETHPFVSTPEYWNPTFDSEANFRYFSDALDYSVDRIKTILYYYRDAAFTYTETGEDFSVLPYIFEIAKYHTNTSNLASEAAWEQINNDGPSNEYYGWWYNDYHEVLDEPDENNNRTAIPQESEAVLNELLQYCKGKNLNVLFVTSPYHAPDSELEQYNYIGDIIESYGFPYLNCNHLYEEIGLDFATDYGDINHTNVIGAGKFTRFLSNYILENYTVPDRRGEAGYEGWEEMYANFAVENESTTYTVNSLVASRAEAYEQGGKLPEITNPSEWLEKINNKNYYILLESNGAAPSENAVRDTLLAQFGLSRENAGNAFRVYKGTEQVCAVDGVQEQNYTDTFSGHSDYDDSYEINCGAKGTIQINGTEYALPGEGIHMVVYDNNYREVLDSVTIKEDADGELVLERE